MDGGLADNSDPVLGKIPTPRGNGLSTMPCGVRINHEPATKSNANFLTLLSTIRRPLLEAPDN